MTNANVSDYCYQCAAKLTDANRDKFKCYICGEPMCSSKCLETHHTVQEPDKPDYISRRAR